MFDMSELHGHSITPQLESRSLQLSLRGKAEPQLASLVLERRRNVELEQGHDRLAGDLAVINGTIERRGNGCIRVAGIQWQDQVRELRHVRRQMLIMVSETHLPSSSEVQRALWRCRSVDMRALRDAVVRSQV